MADRKFRYTFAVGVAGQRRVTVAAYSEEQARDRARRKLDDRAVRNGVEPPEVWDLQLIRLVPAEGSW